MLCRATKVFPIECVMIRGYLSGSAWKGICRARHAGGRELRPGYSRAANSSCDFKSCHQSRNRSRREHHVAADARASSARRDVRAGAHDPRGVWAWRENQPRAGHYHRRHQFEFGRDASGRIILIDEVMNPRRSRFLGGDVYKPGQPQPSFDKQPLRDYLEPSAGRAAGTARRRRPHCRQAWWTPQQALPRSYRRITGAGAEDWRSQLMTLTVREMRFGNRYHH